MTTLTNQSHHSATLTNQAFGLSTPVLFSSGVYYGFGSFTYSGGQQQAAGYTPVLTNQSRHNATLTNQSHH